MNPNYARGQVADAMVNAKSIEKPRIAQQIDQLSKVLAEGHQLASMLENAADRLLGPTPEAAGTSPGTPPSDTIERRLAEAIGYAEALVSRLGNASQRLNTAV